MIIIPVHNSFGGFFNRELIYTAISRARDICITVGQWGALEQAATRIGNNRRITRLTELIKRGTGRWHLRFLTPGHWPRKRGSLTGPAVQNAGIAPLTVPALTRRLSQTV